MRRLLAALLLLAATAAVIPGTFSAFTDQVTNNSTIGANPTFAPILVAAPTIAGTVAANQTLTLSAAGTYRSNVTVTLTYQWQVCTSLLTSTCVDVAGATSTSYALGATPLGSFFRVVETAANGYGTPTATPSAILS